MMYIFVLWPESTACYIFIRKCSAALHPCLWRFFKYANWWNCQCTWKCENSVYPWRFKLLTFLYLTPSQNILFLFPQTPTPPSPFFFKKNKKKIGGIPLHMAKHSYVSFKCLIASVEELPFFCGKMNLACFLHCISQGKF